jgi:hypothetical protein
MNVIYANDAEALFSSPYISENSKKMLLETFKDKNDDNPMLEIFYIK